MQRHLYYLDAKMETPPPNTEGKDERLGLFVSSVMVQWLVRSTASYLEKKHWEYSSSLVSALGPAAVVLFGMQGSSSSRGEVRELANRVRKLEDTVAKLSIKPQKRKRGVRVKHPKEQTT
jgi:hypothetical protein